MREHRLKGEPSNYEEFLATVSELSKKSKEVLADPDVLEDALCNIGRFDGTYYLYLARRSQQAFARVQGRIANGGDWGSNSDRERATAETLLCDLLAFRAEDGDRVTCHENSGNLLDGTGAGGMARRARLAALLWDSPKTQSRLATLLDETPGRWLLEQEIPLIEARRGLLGRRGRTFRRGEDSRAFAFGGRYAGICLSGGGIRSATFNLGVMQALAELKMLHGFDYVSSVSGGGYIHQWFAAWLKRRAGMFVERAFVAGGTRQQGCCRATAMIENALVTQPDRGETSVSPPEVSFLRRFSNYLTPRVGLFSLDTWTLIVTWMRNALLNQVLICAWVISALCAVRLLLWGMHTEPSLLIMRILTFVCPGCFAGAWAGIVFHFSKVGRGPAVSVRVEGDPRARSRDVLLHVCIGVLLGCSLLWTYLMAHTSEHVVLAVVLTSFAFLAVLLALQFASHTDALFRSLVYRPRVVFGATVYSLLLIVAACVLAGLSALPTLVGSVGASDVWRRCGAVTSKVCADWSGRPSPGWGLSRGWTPSPCAHWDWFSVAGPPLVVSLLFLVVLLHHGLQGRYFSTLGREWMARLRAAVTLQLAGWLAVTLLAVEGRQALGSLTHLGSHHFAFIPAVWGLLSGAGLFAGKSGKTSGAHKGKASLKGVSLNVVAVGGSYIFIAGYLLSLSTLVAKIGGVEDATPWRLVSVFAGSLAVGLLYGFRLDINEFSMHAFYRNRLARCYLGASTACRQPEPFTGIDPRDSELNLAELVPGENYPGPFPIFCATANLSVGEDLAWQSRKGTSFALTPLSCGYDIPWQGPDTKAADYRIGRALSYNGYRRTADFGVGGGPSLATAAAISGAAASPNSGFHTSLATAFLMTCANVRLGWWMRNTRLRNVSFDQKSRQKTFFSTPRFPAKYLLLELLGKTSAKTQFLNLTDGGHFDNMGLYELVRRRCRYIVVCDAEEDLGCAFGGIATAIQHCRSDFGVKIDLKLNEMLPVGGAKAGHRFAKSVLVGTIQYPEQPEEMGTILYLKAAVTGDEDGELQSYARLHPQFPDDSTANQWFNEAKFESYRLLGRGIALGAFRSGKGARLRQALQVR